MEKISNKKIIISIILVIFLIKISPYISLMIKFVFNPNEFNNERNCISKWGYYTSFGSTNQDWCSLEKPSILSRMWWDVITYGCACTYNKCWDWEKCIKGKKQSDWY